MVSNVTHSTVPVTQAENQYQFLTESAQSKLLTKKPLQEIMNITMALKTFVNVIFIYKHISFKYFKDCNMCQYVK